MSRVLFASSVLLAAACAATPEGPPARQEIERSEVLSLGDAYASSIGDLRVISVQDEFHVLRAGKAGSIAGYDTVFAVPFDQVRFNRWIRVPSAPGLEVALVTPTKVAFQIRRASEDATR